MIINFGQRTDIPTYYSEWLFNRFREGVVCSRNPIFPNRVTRYLLTPDKVDAVVFCSKDYSPVFKELSGITERFRTLFHFTINGYGRDLEPGSPDEKSALSVLAELARIAGKERIFWRYDPILFTEKYTVKFHLDTFLRMAEKIAPFVAGCILNFAEPSLGLHERIPDLCFGKSERRAVLMGFGSVAKKYSLPLRLCGYGEDYSLFGVGRGGCVSLADIAQANGCKFREVKAENPRRGCACVVTRDVGWYNTCPRGCLYCNAVRLPFEVAVNISRHDPASPLLIGNIGEDDTVKDGSQESYLWGTGGQISIFDL